MKIFFGTVFLLSFLLSPVLVFAAAPGEVCTISATGADPCVSESVCTGGFCILKSKLPPESFRAGIDKDIPLTGTVLIDRIQLIANWVFAFFLAISLIYIVLGAFQFVTAGGDPAQISGARQKLIFALIGIAIGLLTFGIPAIIRSIIV